MIKKECLNKIPEIEEPGSLVTKGQSLVSSYYPLIERFVIYAAKAVLSDETKGVLHNIDTEKSNPVSLLLYA